MKVVTKRPVVTKQQWAENPLVSNEEASLAPNFSGVDFVQNQPQSSAPNDDAMSFMEGDLYDNSVDWVTDQPQSSAPNDDPMSYASGNSFEMEVGEDFSEAFGDKIKEGLAKWKAGKSGRVAKRQGRRTARKEKRAARRLSRGQKATFFEQFKAKLNQFKDKRAEKRKARSTAIPLKIADESTPTNVVFEKEIPVVTTQGSVASKSIPIVQGGDKVGEKTVNIPQQNVTQITTPQGTTVSVDKTDLPGTPGTPLETTPQGTVVAKIPESQVVQAVDNVGNDIIVETKDSTSAKGLDLSSWTTVKKVMIFGVIPAVVITGIVLAVRMNKKAKKSKTK